jgi:hypothetical protein
MGTGPALIVTIGRTACRGWLVKPRRSVLPGKPFRGLIVALILGLAVADAEAVKLTEKQLLDKAEKFAKENPVEGFPAHTKPFYTDGRLERVEVWYTDARANVHYKAVLDASGAVTGPTITRDGKVYRFIDEHTPDSGTSTTFAPGEDLEANPYFAGVRVVNDPSKAFVNKDPGAPLVPVWVIRIVTQPCEPCRDVTERRNDVARRLNELAAEINDIARRHPAERGRGQLPMRMRYDVLVGRWRALRPDLDPLEAERQECEKRCRPEPKKNLMTGASGGGSAGGVPDTARAVGAMFGGATMVSYDNTEMCTFGGGKVAIPTSPAEGGKTTSSPTDPKTGGPPPEAIKPGGQAIAPPDEGAPGAIKPPVTAEPPGKPEGPSVSVPTKPGAPTTADEDEPTPITQPKPGLPTPSQPKTALPGNLIIKATSGAVAGKAGQAVAGAVVKLALPDPALPTAGVAKDAMTASYIGPVQAVTGTDGTASLARSDWIPPSRPFSDRGGMGDMDFYPMQNLTQFPPGQAVPFNVTLDLTPQAGLIVQHGGRFQGLPGVKLGRTWTTGGKTQTAVFAMKENIKAVAAALSKMDGVTHVETNTCRVKEPGSADPYYGSKGTWKQAHDDQWAIKRVGFGPDPGSPWTTTGASKPLVVAVIDTGLDWDHLDIDRANLWTNEKEVPGNGKDDDGNGYVDDIIGWDFMEDDNRPWDRDGHGTFVAGVIAAAHNDVGISGIDPQARIMVLRALNDFGHTRASYLAEAITYAADNGARVVNLSVGGKEPTEAERLAVAYARGKGVLIVAAAGNDAEDVGGYAPAGLPGVLTVAATDFDDRRASFSNWGRRIDLAAPGLDVLSLRARATDLMRDIPGVEYVPGAAYVGADRRYYRASGTSFAAPIVAGAASLVWSRRPELTAEDVARVLVHSAKDVDTPGRDQYTGYGLLDVRAALGRDPRFFVEAEISGVKVATAGGQTVVEVSGTADADRFRAARLEIGPGAGPRAWTPVGQPVAAPVREAVIGSIPAAALAGAKEWTIRVIAEHADGTRREARFNLKLE